MRITESSVTMAAERKHSQFGTKAGGATNRSAFEDIKSSLSPGGYSAGNLDTYSRGSYTGMSGQDIYNNYSKIGGGNLKNGLGSGISSPANDLQNNIIAMLMKRFSLSGVFGGGFGGTTQQLVTYEEYEETQFHANGRAQTDDGRTIDFSIDIMMSRSYMEYMNVRIPSVQNALCDPLVVNVGMSTANVRDQKFRFDIDADGTEDDISMLGKGSGFLALDLNEDGIINDGSELFGTQSGDGFADLRRYDLDGNGWIDENDEIFSRLKIWCKGDDGEDVLMNLKEADIGAIYLGSQETEFTLNGADGLRDGVIRSTGVFLRESTGGGAGTIQHVDMAVGSAEGYESVTEGQGLSGTIVYTNISVGETRRTSVSRVRAERRAILAKKRAEQLQAKNELEARRMEKRAAQEEYEQKLNEKRHERIKKERKLLEESMLERLFENNQPMSFAML